MVSLSLWDELDAEREQALEQTRREIAAEKLAWDALTPEQQAAHTAAVEAKFADIVCEDATCDGCGLPVDDPDCECGYDASDMEDEL